MVGKKSRHISAGRAAAETTEVCCLSGVRLQTRSLGMGDPIMGRV